MQVPSLKIAFEERVEWLTKNFGDKQCKYLQPVKHHLVKDNKHVFKLLEKVEKEGGEG